MLFVVASSSCKTAVKAWLLVQRTHDVKLILINRLADHQSADWKLQELRASFRYWVSLKLQVSIIRDCVRGDLLSLGPSKITF